MRWIVHFSTRLARGDGGGPAGLPPPVRLCLLCVLTATPQVFTSGGGGGGHLGAESEAEAALPRCDRFQPPLRGVGFRSLGRAVGPSNPGVPVERRPTRRMRAAELPGEMRGRGGSLLRALRDFLRRGGVEERVRRRGGRRRGDELERLLLRNPRRGSGRLRGRQGLVMQLRRRRRRRKGCGGKMAQGVPDHVEIRYVAKSACLGCDSGPFVVLQGASRQHPCWGVWVIREPHHLQQLFYIECPAGGKRCASARGLE